MSMCDPAEEEGLFYKVHFDLSGEPTATTADLASLFRDEGLAAHIRRVERIEH